MHLSNLSRRKFLTLAGAAAAAPWLARFTANARAADELEQTELKKLIQGINSFACDLNYRLTKDEPDSLFFSPFSIETALAMTAAGARGQTLDEMRKTLHLPPNPHPAFGELLHHLGNGLERKRPYELTVANAIWAQKEFPWHKEFVELTRKHYGSGLVKVDFAQSEAARKEINNWVEKETRQKIKELIAPGIITPYTRMVLANAIYFKGNWEYQFNKSNTHNAAFTLAGGNKAEVPLMHQTAAFRYGETHVGGRAGDTVQYLELPYAGRELSMLVLLPSRPNFATTLARYITDGNFTRTEMREERVRVWLPRFKAESKFLLNEPLKDLGMKKAFDGADFTGLSPDGKNLAISHVLHKAFVDVNEEGTEAAAATAVVVGKPAPPPNEKVFRADRPFVYVIRDNKTGVALFMGRYAGPAKS